jgi:DNA-binding NarL/FixJ family response regulator
MRLLVADDHPLMRVGICAIIDAQPDMVVAGQAGTSEEAIELFEKLRPDVTIMDLRLPPDGGVCAIERLCQRHPKARFMVLTTYEGDEDIFQALQAGAAGYLVKGISHDVLVKGIRLVHSGKRYLPSEVAQRLNQRNPSSTLSQREHQVLRLLAQGRSNKNIATALGVTEATIKAHVGVILETLQAQDRTEAVIIALQRGLVHL